MTAATTIQRRAFLVLGLGLVEVAVRVDLSIWRGCRSRNTAVTLRTGLHKV